MSEKEERDKSLDTRTATAVRNASWVVGLTFVALIAIALYVSLRNGHLAAQVVALVLVFLLLALSSRFAEWTYKAQGLQTWTHRLPHIVTDMQVAILVAACIGMAIYIAVESASHGGEGGLHVAMEAWIAAAVALITFTFIAIFKAAMLVELGLKILDTSSVLERASLNVKATAEEVSMLGRHGNAASALASLLQLVRYDGAHWRAPEHGRTRGAQIDTLAAFGRNAEYWLRWSQMRPLSGGSEAPRNLVRLAFAEQFAGEMAADIASPSRVVVSNIRYVTRAVSAAHFAIRDGLRDDGKRGMRVPIWLAYTSYEPLLWAEPQRALQMRPQYPQGSAFLQYWGRYLRQMEGISGLRCEKDLTPISLRVFVTNAERHGDVHKSLDENTREILFFDGEKFRHTHTRDVSIKESADVIALRVALDAAEQLRLLRDTHPELLRGWGIVGDCVQELLDVPVPNSPPRWTPELVKTGTSVLARWASQLEGDAFAEAIARAYRWELEFLSNAKSPAIRATFVADLDRKVTWIEGSPFEVVLDALLLTREAAASYAQQELKLSAYIGSRWHGKNSTSYACVLRRDTGGSLACQRLAELAPPDGDIHFFGIATLNEIDLSVAKVEWLDGFVAAMSGELGTARVDLIDIEKGDEVRVSEVQRAAGRPVNEDGTVLSLGEVAAELIAKQPTITYLEKAP